MTIDYIRPAPLAPSAAKGAISAISVRGGYASTGQIAAIVLETDGTLSVMTKPGDASASLDVVRSDAQISLLSELGIAVLLHWLTASFGICLCYHRYLTHRSLKMTPAGEAEDAARMKEVGPPRERLVPDGVMVVPVSGRMTVVRRTAGRPRVSYAGWYSFVPLVEP